jgi:hypothetical protein
MPAGDEEVSFVAVASMAMMGVFCDLSVCVLCLRQDLLESWQQKLSKLPSDRFDVHDLNRRTLSEWETFLAEREPDVTMFHGFHDEVRVRQLSADYLSALVDAVPAGTVIVA